MKNPVILLVDDEDSIVASLRGGLEDEGYIVITALDGLKALDIVKSNAVDMVFLDIWLPGMDGLEILKAIKEFDASIEVIIMTGHGTVNTAVQSVKQGAFDFLEKPFSLDTVLEIIKKIKEKRQAVTGPDKAAAAPGEEEPPVLTGETQSILKIKEQIMQIASQKGHVLLQGETGSGKELVACLIHAASYRKPRPLTKFNCSFYTPDEFETELFGMQKTKDATAGKAGIFTDISEGTVFLESIDALPPKVQKQLGEFLASQNQKSFPVRVIASTLKSTDPAREEVKLHKALYMCFASRLLVPPLRERRGDIPLLLNYFVTEFCREYGFREKTIQDDALDILVNYDWPGNVKELKNMAEKLVVSVSTKNISVQDIPVSFREEIQHSMSRYYEKYKSMDDAEAAWRKNYLLYHLRKNGRDVKKTAEHLHIKDKALKKFIKDYDIILTREKKTEKLVQRTLKRSTVLSGRGLHSGDKTGLILSPMPPNTGIIFGNISTGDTIPANIDFVVSTDYATCLQNTNAVARTIEHFLAVLHAYRITNLMIKINNEVPIMDGSAVDFCQIIEDAGIEDQGVPVDEVIIKEKYVIGEIKKTGKFIMIEPSDKFSIHYTLQYPNPVGRQEFTFVLEDEEVFKTEIAPARTFGFLKDMEALAQKGLANGGRLNNFILIDDEKIVNTDLRFPDEFVRHKILDMMGDMYLLGRPIRGKITANMTGHTENAALVRMISDKMHM